MEDEIRCEYTGEPPDPYTVQTQAGSVRTFPLEVVRGADGVTCKLVWRSLHLSIGLPVWFVEKAPRPTIGPRRGWRVTGGDSGRCRYRVVGAQLVAPGEYAVEVGYFDTEKQRSSWWPMMRFWLPERFCFATQEEAALAAAAMNEQDAAMQRTTSGPEPTREEIVDAIGLANQAGQKLEALFSAASFPVDLARAWLAAYGSSPDETVHRLDVRDVEGKWLGLHCTWEQAHWLATETVRRAGADGVPSGMPGL